MSRQFRNCPASCPIAASAKPERGTWLGWGLSATATALILSAASALALTSGPAPLIDQPIFLTLPPAPAAAQSLAAVSDPAPIANAEAPTQPANTPPEPVADMPPKIPEPQSAAKPTPPDMAKPQQLADAAPEMDTPPPQPDPLPAPDAMPAAAEPPTPAPKPPEISKPKPKKAAAVHADKPKKIKQKTTKASSTATTAGGATAATKAAKATAQGQSPAAYTKAVLKKIRGTKKRATPGKGSAVVGFAISASGRLSLVKIVQSSGSAALDAAALDHIQRSAPFPAPPAGVSTRFSFEFVGR